MHDRGVELADGPAGEDSARANETRRQPDRGGGQPREFTERFLIRDHGKLHFVLVADVDWIESRANYLRLHAGRRTHLIRMGISEVARRLDPRRFVRIHRTKIVNIERVVQLTHVVNGDYDVFLTDGTRLRLSRSYRQNLLGDRVVNGS